MKFLIDKETKSGSEEGPQIDIPGTETKTQKRKPKSKRGEKKTEGEEEILQLGNKAISCIINQDITLNLKPHDSSSILADGSYIYRQIVSYAVKGKSDISLLSRYKYFNMIEHIQFTTVP